MKKVEKIKDYYEPKIQSKHNDYEVLGWESQEAQELRFKVFAEHTNLSGLSLLDVGCGLGNLHGYMKKKGYNVDYTGVDILISMIDKAKGKYTDARFIHTNIFEHDIFEHKQFDVVYACGMFNLNLGNNIEFLLKAVNKFMWLSKQIVSISLLDWDSQDKEEQYCYYKSDDVLELLNECTKNSEWKAEIIKGYLQNDFTVFLKV